MYVCEWACVGTHVCEWVDSDNIMVHYMIFSTYIQ